MEGMRLTIAMDSPAAWPEARHAVIAHPDQRRVFDLGDDLS